MNACLKFQIDPSKYKSISSGFGVLLKEQGFRGFFRGWVPTLLGYSAQGACKFGFYEFFKKYYSDIAGPEYAAKYKTLIYLAGSASAEVIADVALCPFEAVKVRVQTQPGFARGLSDGLPRFVRSEGALGYVSSLFFLPFASVLDCYCTRELFLSGGVRFLAVKKLGVLGLFTRGLPLRIVMIGTLTGAHPTTGGVAPAAVPSPELAD
ncbi:hypothetical protein GW17_00046572 [Ensete ventricosum]|nr:hypothetical protein GW17_00046572 [Ensete ventricosum]